MKKIIVRTFLAISPSPSCTYGSFSIVFNVFASIIFLSLSQVLNFHSIQLHFPCEEPSATMYLKTDMLLSPLIQLVISSLSMLTDFFCHLLWSTIAVRLDWTTLHTSQLNSRELWPLRVSPDVLGRKLISATCSVGHCPQLIIIHGQHINIL